MLDLFVRYRPEFAGDCWCPVIWQPQHSPTMHSTHTTSTLLMRGDHTQYTSMT